MSYTGTDFYCDEVLSGKTPVVVLAQTERVLAFEHTRPFWPVHVVVVPKIHVPSLIDLGDGDETLLAEVLSVVRDISSQVTTSPDIPQRQTGNASSPPGRYGQD